jgi:HK97 family phage major capsid protein
MGRKYSNVPLGAAEDVEDWIYDEHSAKAIEKLMQRSAVELLARPEPMNAAVKTVPRDGGFTVGAVAKGGPYNLSTSDNDDIEITARKIGGAIELNEEDLNDPTVDVLATKRRGATRDLAIFHDNSTLGTSAASNGTTVPFESLYYAVRHNGDSSSIEASYTADDNYTAVTAANFVANMGSGTGYNALNDWLGKYEESDFFDEENTFVIASPSFRKLLRGVKDADGNPFLVPNGSLNGRVQYDILGYRTVWSMGARKTAVAQTSFNATLNRPLLIIGNRDLLISGKAKIQGNIPAEQPGFALQRANQGIGFLSDKAYMKAAIRRGFRVGTRLGVSLLEVTA